MLDILGVIVLAMLTMVSYSSGITLAARRRNYEPVFLDLLVVVLLWVMIFWLRPQLSRLPLLATTIGIGVAVGYIVGALRLSGIDETHKIPDSELPEHARDKEGTPGDQNVFRRGWGRWSRFAERMGTIQGRIFMGFFYFVFVTPFGLIGRWFTDSLSIKKSPMDSNWKVKEPIDLTIETAREQG